MALDAQRSGPQILGAEKVAKYGVKKDAFGKAVLLQLVSDDGVPYMFAVPPEGRNGYRNPLARGRRQGSRDRPRLTPAAVIVEPYVGSPLTPIGEPYAGVRKMKRLF